jgi:hypothetical protein
MPWVAFVDVASGEATTEDFDVIHPKLDGDTEAQVGRTWSRVAQ